LRRNKLLNFRKIFAIGNARGISSAGARRLAGGRDRAETQAVRGFGWLPLALAPSGITTWRLNDANAENRCQNDNNWLAEDLLMSREILRFAAHGTIEVDTASRTLRATTKKMLTYFGLNGRKATPKEARIRKRARRDLETFVSERFGDGKSGWTWLTPEGKKVKT